MPEGTLLADEHDEHSGIHRGVWYRMTRANESSWDYFFREGVSATAGRANAPLGMIAARRARSIIDRQLQGKG